MKTDNYTTAKNFVQGYEANANNLRTDGIILVSYYTVIGLRAEYKNTNFANVLFLCRAGYSNTTRKHKSHVYSNASRYGYKVIEVNEVRPYNDNDHTKNLKGFEEAAKEYRTKAERARTDRNKAAYMEQAKREEENERIYKAVYKLA